MTDTIHSDVPNGSVEDAANALLDKWSDDESPSDDNEDETADEYEDSNEDDESPSENDDDDENGEPEEDEDDGDETDEKTEVKVADDDHVVKLKLDGKEVDVKVADLKRLYGQEANITRKGQEVAETRKALEDEGARYVASAEHLLSRAMERFNAYRDVDWFRASRELPPEQFEAMRADLQYAAEDVRFFQTELDGFLKNVQQARQQEQYTQAKRTIAELSDPKTGIPGFSEQLYGQMREYASSVGIPNEQLDSLVDPKALRIIHKAMLYDKGQKVATKVVSKAPKQLVKGNQSPEGSRKAAKGDGKALAQARKTGSVDDAMKALLSKWGSE